MADLAELIARGIVDDPPFVLRDGGIIADGYHGELDDLRSLSREGKGFIAGLEAREKARTGINSLKIRYNKVFGYYIEVTRANLAAIPDDYIRKQTLANAERYITPELKDYEEKCSMPKSGLPVLNTSSSRKSGNRLPPMVKGLHAARISWLPWMSWLPLPNWLMNVTIAVRSWMRGHPFHN